MASGVVSSDVQQSAGVLRLRPSSDHMEGDEWNVGQTSRV